MSHTQPTGTGRHAVDPTFSGTLPTPHPVRDFLVEEMRKRHTEYEVLRRDRDVLVQQHHANPMSVRSDRIETATRLVEEARVVDRYLGSMLAAFPAVTL